MSRTGETCDNTATTGSQGAVFLSDLAVARVTQWTLDISTSGVRYFSTDARAWSKFIPSVHTGTGKVDFIYESELRFSDSGNVVLAPQDTVVQPGAYVSLSLFINAAAKRGWYIPSAVVMGYSMSVDVRTAEIVGGSFSFEVDGILVVPDSSRPTITPVVPPGFGAGEFFTLAAYC